MQQINFTLECKLEDLFVRKCERNCLPGCYSTYFETKYMIYKFMNQMDVTVVSKKLKMRGGETYIFVIYSSRGTRIYRPRPDSLAQHRSSPTVGLYLRQTKGPLN